MNNAEIGKRLKKYLADNQMSEMTLAKATNTDQTQISRIKNGKFKQITDNVKRVCEYASIDLKEETDLTKNADLMSALYSVWDGTDERARALAKVIKSLKELV